MKHIFHGVDDSSTTSQYLKVFKDHKRIKIWEKLKQTPYLQF